jgi:hypothetical protein
MQKSLFGELFQEKRKRNKLCVFGSRSIIDERVLNILEDFLKENPKFDTIVTSAEPTGVCAIAKVFAERKHIILEMHFLNQEKYGQGKYEHRGDEAMLASDFILFIHDGESKGTFNELERAKKFHIEYHYVVIPSTELYYGNL